MSVVKLKKVKKPNILFGIILNNLESNLYHAISNKKLANEVLKESLNIHSRRLIQIVDAVNAKDEVMNILVVYDTILTENEEYRIMQSLDVKNFDFNIFNFSRRETVDVEKIIDNLV